MIDVGLTHVGLTCRDLEQTTEFWQRWAGMAVVHRRVDATTGRGVAWMSDRTRPFVLVFIETEHPDSPLGPHQHVGVGLASVEELDIRITDARQAGVSVSDTIDSGPPVGIWAALTDPNGHILELSYGQEVGLAVSGQLPIE